MDSDTIKLAFALAAGALALIGGLLTFLNGRLSEAKTQRTRSNIIFSTITALAILNIIVGTAIFFFLHSLWAEVFFATAFIISLVHYVRGGYSHWLNVLVFAILCSFYISAMFTLIPLYLMLRVVDVLTAHH
jgi:hypothetical protein